MMERYKGYWITGSAVPGPPYTHYWESFGKILKDGRGSSVVEVVRFRDKTMVLGSTTTCAGWPSFTGWKLAGSPLTIYCPQSEMARYLFRNWPRCQLPRHRPTGTGPQHALASSQAAK
jgi:hypothetical protein